MEAEQASNDFEFNETTDYTSEEVYKTLKSTRRLKECVHQNMKTCHRLRFCKEFTEYYLQAGAKLCLS